MTYELALENVKADRKSAVAFVKREFPNDVEAKNIENLSDERLAVLYAEAYSSSEWGI